MLFMTREAPVFKELTSRILKDQVIAAMKAAFFSRELKPGDAIVERQVAQQMKIGTPAVREALVSLQEQGFVRRIANTATYVTEFTPEEVRQLYTLRVELESLAFHWAKMRVTKQELAELESLVDLLVEAGELGAPRLFLERDLEFHTRCWALSGNRFLAETLERLMTPLFIFVVLASDAPLSAAMAREHYLLVNALRDLEEPRFSAEVRAIVTRFASRWIVSMAPEDGRVPSKSSSVERGLALEASNE